METGSRTSSVNRKTSIKSIKTIAEEEQSGSISDAGDSTNINAEKRNSAHDSDLGDDPILGSHRVPKKFITTWRHACDKTKDRTKDLFKRWRTMPETATESSSIKDFENGSSEVSKVESTDNTNAASTYGWSVHVWATWVKRYPSDEEDNMFDGELDAEEENLTNNINLLSSVQKDKLEHLFTHLLDTDRDGLISIQDFNSFCQRLKHFSDWTDNSPEFITLQQIKEEIIQHFILSRNVADKKCLNNEQNKKDTVGTTTNKLLLEVISLEEWLGSWGKLLQNAKNVTDFPIWLQYLPKILFRVINSSGSGEISKEELSAFYSAILSLTTVNVNELLGVAYKAMTANEHHSLTYSVYRLCFANFLLGRHPNGPGQYIFGHIEKPVECFPIDYSAMNTPPDQLEKYTTDKKSNRHSVIV